MHQCAYFDLIPGKQNLFVSKNFYFVSNYMIDTATNGNFFQADMAITNCALTMLGQLWVGKFSEVGLPGRGWYCKLFNVHYNALLAVPSVK